MAALWKYDIVALDAAHTKDREEHMRELGRGGWEVIAVLPGDYRTGDMDAPKVSLFMKREATHDINF